MVEQNPYQAPSAELGSATLSSGTYEFSDLENNVIGRTASRTKIWGVISLITGVFSAAGLAVLIALWGTIESVLAQSSQVPMNTSVMFGAIAMLIPLSLVHLVIGVYYLGSGGALSAVVQTEGNDVELLMRGLNKLANAFRAEVIVTIISAVIGVVMFIANFIAAAAS